MAPFIEPRRSISKPQKFFDDLQIIADLSENAPHAADFDIFVEAINRGQIYIHVNQDEGNPTLEYGRFQLTEFPHQGIVIDLPWGYKKYGPPPVTLEHFFPTMMDDLATFVREQTPRITDRETYFPEISHPLRTTHIPIWYILEQETSK